MIGEIPSLGIGKGKNATQYFQAFGFTKKFAQKGPASNYTTLEIRNKYFASNISSKKTPRKPNPSKPFKINHLKMNPKKGLIIDTIRKVTKTDP